MPEQLDHTRLPCSNTGPWPYALGPRLAYALTVLVANLTLLAKMLLPPPGLGSPSRPKVLDNVRTPLGVSPTFKVYA